MHIVDRRLDSSGKSIANRQRFIRRARGVVRQAVRDAVASRSIRDVGEGGAVSIPANSVHEPTFRRSGEGGVRDYVLPGNKQYVAGDRISRPPEGGGSGSEGAEDGSGEDQFSFVLTRDEFLQFFLEDLELPDMAKREVTGEAQAKRLPAGFRTTGSPAALSVPRTLRRSLSRRIALKRPDKERLRALEAEIETLERSGTEPARLAELKLELEALLGRVRSIPFIDPVDLRYRRTTQVPEPTAQAVMFCLMDVSGSMDEHMKDLAKRFFSLLYLFLTTRYSKVSVVFIRHTHEAQEVDEETFFRSRESGGTIVSTALKEMQRIVAERFPADRWNIYAAQASDGDNVSGDNALVAELLRSGILPITQYYAYLQVGRADEGRSYLPSRESGLWRALEGLLGEAVPLAMRKVAQARDIYPVFRDLFERKATRKASA
ncbi:YeaH/YhbH family protein [Aureimonas leprariae]|uniref:UPF0229 protein F6X38_19000 n=1 Tax=Plantimonas leprariae TaxID=2615207 RepID=A0A7V7TV52_9HYPH|nr:YeaH/YhbH family protein [Aureimonas leprariae]KAB0677210.1 YeaH/YhbH family protein [Aureimonas leprariae]